MSARSNAQTAALEALIEAHATELKLPTVSAENADDYWTRGSRC